jgi:hypothetical protein
MRSTCVHEFAGAGKWGNFWALLTIISFPVGVSDWDQKLDFKLESPLSAIPVSTRNKSNFKYAICLDKHFHPGSIFVEKWLKSPA